MRRGDIVRVSGRGEFSRKPRPALVVQSDLFNGRVETVILCPITSEITGNRLTRVAIQPTETSGLREGSEVQVDKIEAVRLLRLRGKIGEATKAQMLAVDRALRLWLDV